MCNFCTIQNFINPKRVDGTKNKNKYNMQTILLTINNNTMEEHDIDALIDMRYGIDHLESSDD